MNDALNAIIILLAVIFLTICGDAHVATAVAPVVLGRTLGRHAPSMKYTARITGRGEDSTVPDDAGAVDADISLDGRVLGSVTLLPDTQGDLGVWGDCMSRWADADIMDHLSDLEDYRNLAVESIVAAVRAAAVRIPAGRFDPGPG